MRAAGLALVMRHVFLTPMLNSNTLAVVLKRESLRRTSA